MGKSDSQLAALAFGIGKPDSLDEAILVIEKFRELARANLEKIAAIGEELIGTRAAVRRLAEIAAEHRGEEEIAKDRVDELEDEVLFTEEDIRELSCIEQKFRRGRPNEAHQDLDRLLQKIDCGGTHRLTAVPVML